MEIKKTETFTEHDIVINGTKVGEVELCPERKEITGLVIFESYQNKGYGTEVMRKLIEDGFSCLWVRSDDSRAIHVYEKCGFVKGETVMFEMKYQGDINEHSSDTTTIDKVVENMKDKHLQVSSVNPNEYKDMINAERRYEEL